MCRRLRARAGVVDRVVQAASLARGAGVEPGADAGAGPFARDGAYDVVSLLNVIDRCDQPADLLRDACRLARRDGGRVLLAVVLPFSEFVEDGSLRRHPRGALPMRRARCGDGVSFEGSLDALLQRVLLARPLGNAAAAAAAGDERAADSDGVAGAGAGVGDEDGPHMVLERVARVPYLCQGDTTSRRRYFVLSDAIIVLRHATDEERARGGPLVAAL